MRRLTGRLPETCSRFRESDHRGPLPRRGPDICFMEDNLLHAISKLRCVQFDVVVKSSSCTLKGTVHGASIEIGLCVKRSLTRG